MLGKLQLPSNLDFKKKPVAKTDKEKRKVCL